MQPLFAKKFTEILVNVRLAKIHFLNLFDSVVYTVLPIYKEREM